MLTRSITRARSFSDPAFAYYVPDAKRLHWRQNKFEQLEVVSVPNIERSNPVCGTLGILCLSRE
jgi:hypothetical protein